MIAFVSLTLLLVTAAVGVVSAVMFCEVAFAGPRCALAFAPGSSGSRSRSANPSFDGAELARRVEQAVSRTIASLEVKPSDSSCVAACYQRSIAVTVPEVLAIVEELQESQSPAQVEAIRIQAQRNLKTPNTTHSCPLLMSGGFCACETARPVSCRTRCIAGADSPVEARRLAESVETGVTEIFRDCLNASGLDHGRYELNSALTQVLNTPQAAHRWARGEQILKASAID